MADRPEPPVLVAETRLSRRAALGGIGGVLAAALVTRAEAKKDDNPGNGKGGKHGDLGTPVAPLGRTQHTATALHDGRILVAGGDYLGILASVQIYDSATNRWFDAAPLSQPRRQHAAALLPDGRVLVAGGFHTGPLTSVEIYDVRDDEWEEVSPLQTPRFDHSAAGLHDGALVTGGVFRGPLTTVEIYDFRGDSWQEIA